MSILSEKAAYIKGLAEGLDIDATSKEGKLLKALIEAFGDVADAIGEIVEIQDEMQLQLDDVDDDLADLENVIYDDEDEDEDEEDYDDIFSSEFSFVCPECGESIYVDDELLDGDEDFITCPSCGKKVELEFDHGCNCGCEDCDDCDED
ncbi:MAG: hypothetical protein Q4C12_07785 [Clostridia bacterium]|nr:hypothetical protein [Clostridia bacterium]